jgi:hypothetical protein
LPGSKGGCSIRWAADVAAASQPAVDTGRHLMTERSTTELYESIQANLRETIMTHLKTPAVSLSSHEAKRTGNAYQAIRLGDQVIPGFRSAQRHVFAGVNLKNKTVLDLGSNLGEVARVDGMWVV